MCAVFVEKLTTFYGINVSIKLDNTYGVQSTRACSLCLIPSWDDAATVSLTWGESSSQKDEHNSVVVLMVKSQGQEEVGFWNESLWACKQWMLSSTSQQLKLLVSIHVCLRRSVTLHLLIPVSLPLSLTMRRVSLSAFLLGVWCRTGFTWISLFSGGRYMWAWCGEASFSQKTYCVLFKYCVLSWLANVSHGSQTYI